MEIGIIANPKKAEAKEILKKIVPFLLRKRVRVKFLKSARYFGYEKQIVPPKEFLSSSSLIIAIGGDGTILSAAHLVEEREIPIMGINVGSLGFLAFFSKDEAMAALSDFLKGKATIEERIALRCQFKGKDYFALNDVTVNMGKSLRAIEVILYSQGEYISTFLGDGVILATPTGSTAYSLACGGSIIYPTLSNFIITPIAPHALSARPLIIPAERVITVELAKESESGNLVIDGQVREPILPKERAYFRKAKKPVKIICPREGYYFALLRQKMRWGGLTSNRIC